LPIYPCTSPLLQWFAKGMTKGTAIAESINTLWPVGVADASERPILVPGPRFGDGSRLAFLFVKAIEERCNPQADFLAVIKHQEKISPALGGSSVFD
jgi:hypothetical protein